MPHLPSIKLIPLFLLPSLAPAVTTIMYGPSRYFSAVDSPFYQGIVDNTGAGIWLEDFEDQQLNTPYVSQPLDQPFIGDTLRSRSPNIPDGIVHSVDGDDGAVDGSAFLGDSWVTRSKATQGGSGRVHFDFAPDHLGRLPTYVGIVVTEPLSFFTDVDFIPLDRNGAGLPIDGELDPFDWDAEVPNNSPELHRFIGVYHEDGISSLILSNVAQSDHLQYGYSIPEPGSTMLGMMAFFLLVQRRR